jgi:hypothetical protein
MTWRLLVRRDKYSYGLPKLSNSAENWLHFGWRDQAQSSICINEGEPKNSRGLIMGPLWHFYFLVQTRTFVSLSWVKRRKSCPSRVFSMEASWTTGGFISLRRRWDYTSGSLPIWRIECDNTASRPPCTKRGPFQKLTPSKESERSKVGVERRNCSWLPKLCHKRNQFRLRFSPSPTRGASNQGARAKSMGLFVC